MNTMKKYLISTCFLAASLLAGCNLDVRNMTDYDADLVWRDPALATAYINGLYGVFGNSNAWADQNSEQITGIPFYVGQITISGGGYKNWNYATVRRINEAIVQLDASDMDDEVRTSLSAQALVMRALVYYSMVNYHGGVPYLKAPQDRYKDDLFPPRNSTADCFKFIIEDIDAAMAGLPDVIAASSDDYGRIDKVYAKAFKAKVLLLKASPQFNPSKPYDNAYWQEAYTAANEAYTFAREKGKALTPNYDDIFIKEGGTEPLMVVINQYPDKTTGWDNSIRPMSLCNDGGSHPTWDMVKAFPMADGKKFDDPTGKYVVTEDELMQSFFANRDPRFYSSILCPGQEYPVAGTASGYRQYTALGVVERVDAYGVNPDAGVIANTTQMDRGAGLFIRKAADMSLTQVNVRQTGTDFIVMRLAELMLIYAEAANETGHSDVTVQMLKDIRHRAGIEPGDDGNYGLPASPSREELRGLILDERNVELCFEGHRFWDLRRTRNLDVLKGLQKYSLESIAINPDGTDMPIAEAFAKGQAFELTPEDFRYDRLRVPYNPNAENTFVVEDTFYFFPLQQSVLDENDNLEQNNNWGGTFNPTME